MKKAKQLMAVDLPRVSRANIDRVRDFLKTSPATVDKEQRAADFFFRLGVDFATEYYKKQGVIEC